MAVVEYSIKQRCCKRNRLSGDVVLCRESDENNTFRAVLCDGLGHGVKANILANMTSTMVMMHDFDNDSLKQLTETILAIQPVCDIRHINHCTYTLIEYDEIKNVLGIVNYDNPNVLVFSEGDYMDVDWDILLNESYATLPQKMQFKKLTPINEITLILFSDGITQSGTGLKFAFGWGETRIKKFLRTLLEQKLPVEDICTLLMSESLGFEEEYSHDDNSCIVIRIII